MLIYETQYLCLVTNISKYYSLHVRAIRGVLHEQLNSKPFLPRLVSVQLLACLCGGSPSAQTLRQNHCGGETTNWQSRWRMNQIVLMKTFSAIWLLICELAQNVQSLILDCSTALKQNILIHS